MIGTKLIQNDHNVVRKLFKEYKAAGDKAIAAKRLLFETIKAELVVHTSIEEEILYPRAAALGVEDLHDSVFESAEEHLIAKRLLDELTELEPSGDRDVFEAKMKVLMESVEHHAEEEEKEMLPQMEKNMDRDDLEALGDELEARKQELKAELEKGVRAKAPAAKSASRASSAKPAAKATKRKATRATGGTKRTSREARA